MFQHETDREEHRLLIVLTFLTVSVGGLVEIVPLFFQKSTTEPVEGRQALRRRCN
jgi:cytochrome c oxidase cbb3-type subunit 2